VGRLLRRAFARCEGVSRVYYAAVFSRAGKKILAPRERRTATNTTISRAGTPACLIPSTIMCNTAGSDESFGPPTGQTLIRGNGRSVQVVEGWLIKK
jgi:hypothetical protein